MAESNRELLATGFRATREALLSLGDNAETYAAAGTPVTVGRYSRLFDEAI